MQDNIKARVLDNELKNDYVTPITGEPLIRSQYETYFYLRNKIEQPLEVSRH
jgi:hypothetical protein